MGRVISVAIALLALLALTSPAAAKCRYPTGFFSTPADGKLPADPIVYLFLGPRHVPDGTPPPAPAVRASDARGLALPVKLTLASQMGAFHVYRVKLTVAAPSRITLQSAGDGRPIEASYQVVTDWKRPAPEPVEVTAITGESFRWTCSHQHSRNVKLSTPAMAYRFEWARTVADYRAGKVESIILPFQMDLFFGRNNRDSATAGMLELGYVNCTGQTFDFGHGVVIAGVRALYPDGAETPRSPKPVSITPP